MSKNLTYMLLKRKQGQYIKAYATLCLVLLLILGGYSYKKWDQFSLINRASDSGQTYIAALGNEVATVKSEYDLGKTDYDELNEGIEKNLEYIFPASDDYTNLTREIDSYEEQLSTKNSTFDVSSLNFEAVTVGDRYSILPVRMSIRSSADNFKKFLHLIENSGALSGNSRLMDISSIRLSFEGREDTEEQSEEIINFNVQINAYFQ